MLVSYIIWICVFRNKQAIQDKYCLRGAEWGVGDCSTEGMRPDERDEFIAMLKKKTGQEWSDYRCAAHTVVTCFLLI